MKKIMIVILGGFLLALATQLMSQESYKNTSSKNNRCNQSFAETRGKEIGRYQISATEFHIAETSLVAYIILDTSCGVIVENRAYMPPVVGR